MSFATVASILGQLLALSVVGGATASVALRLLRLRGDRTPGAPGQPEFRNIYLGAPERWLLSIAGAVLFSVIGMIVNIVSAGAFFGSPVGVPLITAVVLLVWFRRKPWGDRWFLPRTDGGASATLRRSAPALVLLAVILAIFVVPALLAGSSVRTGDPPWHLGWTEQLLRGEALPSGPAPEFGRNAYPWGLHAFMGTLVRLIPGTSPLTALETLHVLLALALPLAAACLARIIDRRAGLFAAAAGALVGGFGWLGGDPSFATSPAGGRFGADLVVASPNSAYELLPPGLPRELGLVLVAASIVLLAVYRNTHEQRGAVGAGVVAGLAGLVSVPMFVVALVWITCASAAHKGGRLRLLFTSGVSALAVFLLWAAYALVQADQNGGFVNITPRLGMEWSLPTAFGSWGLLLPLAIGGVLLQARRARERSPLAVALLGGSLVLLSLAVLRGVFDWQLAGNATLLHQGRIWPAVHLLGAAFAGHGLAVLYARLKEHSAELAVATVAVIFTVGVASLVIARESLHEVMENRLAGYEYGSPDVRDEDGFLRRAAPFLGPGSVVSAEDSDRLTFRLFEVSGVKLASFDDSRLTSNDLRIRYANLAEAWDRQMSAGGFSADFTARRGTSEPAEGEELLTTGTFGGDVWSLYAAR